MKTDTRNELRELIERLENFRDEVYDYDYDDTALWHLDEAIKNLKRI